MAGANKKSIFLFGISVIIAVSLFFYFYSKESAQNPLSEDCSFDIQKETVNGRSLSGLIEDGETVYFHYGYFDCEEIKRGDVVAYSYAGRNNPIIKVVKGVPGDEFKLKKNGGGWNILINGEIAKNSSGENYVFGDKAREMLSLYERDYGGKIPPDAYLLFGNLTSGTLDSTRFGLVSRGDILGAILPY